MFSDIFYLDTAKQHKLVLYNQKLLTDTIKNLKKIDIKKIIKQCEKNIQLLTYDILALLNIFKHFIQCEQAKTYIKQHELNFDNKLYVFTNYFQKRHFWLKNSYQILNIINKYSEQNNLKF